MTTTRTFTCDDLFRFNNINFDYLTETYNLAFYLSYMAKWPHFFSAVEGPTGRLMGYIMGKAEGDGKNWHGHVTAVTVAPEFRKQGLAGKMMGWLEDMTDAV